MLLAPGLAAEIPLGKVAEGVDQSTVFSSPGPALALDLGVGVAPSLVLGIWGNFAVFSAKDCSVSGTSLNNRECSIQTWALGPALTFFAPTSGSVRPWISGGFGYRWARRAEADTIGNTTGALTVVDRGFEWLHAQAGVDIAMSERAWIGPFVSLDVGTYSQYSSSGDLVSGGSGQPTELVPIDRSGDIENTATHEYLLLGARVLFDLPLKKGASKAEPSDSQEGEPQP